MRRTASSLVSVTALLAATACTAPAPPDNTPTGSPTPITITIGLPEIPEVAPIYLGLREGFFSERGILLEIDGDSSSHQLQNEFLEGKFAFTYADTVSVLRYSSHFESRTGTGVRALANGASSTGRDGADFAAIVVPADSPIQSAKDLAGKELRVDENQAIGELTAREAIRAAGGDPSGIRAFPTPDSWSWSSVGGDYQAGYLVEPWLTEAVQEQDMRVISSSYVDTAPDLTAGLYLTTQKFAQDNPDLAAAFTEAVNESLTYADTHPDEVRAILGTYVDPYEDFDSGIYEAMTLPRWPTAINRASIERLAALGTQYELISKVPDLNALLP